MGRKLNRKVEETHLTWLFSRLVRLPRSARPNAKQIHTRKSFPCCRADVRRQQSFEHQRRLPSLLHGCCKLTLKPIKLVTFKSWLCCFSTFTRRYNSRGERNRDRTLFPLPLADDVFVGSLSVASCHHFLFLSNASLSPRAQSHAVHAQKRGRRGEAIVLADSQGNGLLYTSATCTCRSQSGQWGGGGTKRCAHYAPCLNK